MMSTSVELDENFSGYARLSGQTSRSHAHESMQILSNPEETTLVRWITYLTSTGFPASPALAIQMAEEIRNNQYRLPKASPPSHRSIGKSWLDRFRKRHPEIQGVWTRKIEGVRHNAMRPEAVKTWFEAVTELCIQHQYSPDQIYDMDESGLRSRRVSHQERRSMFERTQAGR